jgi:hypothetical protein
LALVDFVEILIPYECFFLKSYKFLLVLFQMIQKEDRAKAADIPESSSESEEDDDADDGEDGSGDAGSGDDSSSGDGQGDRDEASSDSETSSPKIDIVR